MTQTLLFLVLHCLGVSVCLAFGPRQRVLLCCALGFSVGLAVAVMLVLLLVGLHIPYTALTGGIAAAVVLAGCLTLVVRRGGLAPDAWRTIAIWAAAFSLLSLPLTHVNLSFLTYDSHLMVMMGGAISADGTLMPGVIEHLADYGVFQVGAQALVGFTSETYLYSLATVLGLSTIPVFALMLGAGLEALAYRGPSRRGLIALVTAATFTVYMVARHFFYIHTNLGSAVFLFEFTALFWLAEVEKDGSTLPIAFVALTALALHRIENPIICVMFLAMMAPQSKLPARTLLAPLAAYSAAVVAWYLLLATKAPPETQFLTPGKCYFVIAITVAFLGYAALCSLTRLRFLEIFTRRVPLLIAVLCAVVMVAAFHFKHDHMWTSADIWLHNLWDSTYWAGTWLAIAALALVGLFAPGPPFRQVFTYGIPVYFAMILLVVYGRDPYRLSPGDSAARMAIHLIPMTFFYFGIKFAPLLPSRDDAAA